MRFVRWANEWERRVLREGAEKEEKRLQRWKEHGPTWWLMRTVAPMILVMSLAQYLTVRDHRTDQRVDSLLSRDGVVADGRAIQFSVHFGWGALIYTDSVKVAFKTSDGRNIETWLPHEIPVERGPVRVRYLRTDPSIARLVDDPAPREGRWVAVAWLHVATIVLSVPLVLLLRRRALNRA